MNILYLFFLSFFICNQVFAQDYQPFNNQSPKRFYNISDSTENEHFFYPVDSVISNDSLILKQGFKNLEFLSSSFNCTPWGDAYQTDTNWLGRKIIYDINDKKLTLFNKLNQTLTFDFNLAVGDSSIFFVDSNKFYYIKLDSIYFDNVLNSSDSIKSFLINVYDSIGSIHFSEFNNFKICLGKKYGLISFMDVNQFPQVEKKLQLLGQINPNIGYYQMTYDEAFPYNINDVIQYYGINENSQIGLLTESVRTYTVTNKIETDSTVELYFDVQTRVKYNMDYSSPSFPPPAGPISVFNAYIPNPLVFSKGALITTLPLNIWAYSAEHLDYVKYDSDCINGQTIMFDRNFQWYCEEDNNFIDIDQNGSSFLREKYKQSRGLVFVENYRYGNIDDQYAEMIYSNINGTICGELSDLSIDESMFDNNIVVVKIYDVFGREVLNPSQNNLYIYLYSNGSYRKEIKVVN